VLEPLSGYLNLAAKLYVEGRKYCGGWNFGPEDTANYSVKDLIEEILIIDEKGGYYTSENLQKPHEATFLKLDISKAVNRLQWKPILTFKETVSFTVSGYQDDINDLDLFEKRNEQIKAYTQKAIQKGVSWAL
jgi:CDP-glucose 4,6-dehydratase